MEEKKEVLKPFFAQFLEGQETPAGTRGRTDKFPSDLDEWDD